MNKHERTHMDGPDLYSSGGALSLRYMVLNAKSVRRFLATGVVDVPAEMDVFSPEFDRIGEGRRLLNDSDLCEVIKVVSVKDGCVARLSDHLVSDDQDMLKVPIPVVMIDRLLFPSVQQANDWAGRSKNFPGIGPLPLVEARDDLQFTEAVLQESAAASPDAQEEAGALVTDLQRLSGSIVTLLASSNTGSGWMQPLAEGPLERALQSGIRTYPEGALCS
jgi:hypothetical protein